MWHNAFTCAKQHIHLCNMTDSHELHCWFKCVTRHIPFPFTLKWRMHMRSWLIHVCDMPHSHMWHAKCECDMPNSHVWRAAVKFWNVWGIFSIQHTFEFGSRLRHDAFIRVYSTTPACIHMHNTTHLRHTCMNPASCRLWRTFMSQRVFSTEVYIETIEKS